MNEIEHVIEPTRLLVVWQPALGHASRTRRVVAEIISDPTSSGPRLRYLPETEDYRLALEAGFRGYPAFRLGDVEHHQNVLDGFLRRIPPRNREDFSEYLKMYRLPVPFRGSDQALLAYTGARLPGDGFEIAADLSTAEPPFELVMEVAGFRYQDGLSVGDLTVGDPVQLLPEPLNDFDPHAIAVMHDGGRIGYVCRPYLAACHRWLNNAVIIATIDRINGKEDRPLIYIFVRVRPKHR